MLYRKRPFDNLYEIDFLMRGNPPTSLDGKPEKANQMLCLAGKIFNIDAEPLDIWYSILLAIGDENLLFIQRRFAHNKNINTAPYTNALHVSLDEIMNASHGNYDYTCIYTYESTDLTGGYIFNKHAFNDDVCSPKYVISNEAYDILKSRGHYFKCPNCNTYLTMENLSKISKQVDFENNYKNLENIIHNPEFENKHEIIDLNDTIGNAIKLLDDCVFDVKSFYVIGGKTFVNYYITKTLSLKNNNDIANAINEHYPFLNNISFTHENGFCIAGGFCTNLLFGDKCINDIDIFLHKNVLPSAIIAKIDEIYNAMIQFKYYLKMQCVYKNNTNVIDILFHSYNTIEYKFQIILIKHDTVEEIFNEFDINSCCAMYYDNKMYLSQRAEHSFKYMMNTIDINCASPIYSGRVAKYFYRGFAIGMKEELLKYIDYEKTGCSDEIHKNINYVAKVTFTEDFDKPYSMKKIKENNGENTKPLYDTDKYYNITHVTEFVKQNPNTMTLFNFDEIKLAKDAFLQVGNTKIKGLISRCELQYVHNPDILKDRLIEQYFTNP